MATDREIGKLRRYCNDSSHTPKNRILAARKLLRMTDYSARSVAIAKRVAKLFMHDELQIADIRKKATSLFEFAINPVETDKERDESDAINSTIAVEELTETLTVKEPERSQTDSPGFFICEDRVKPEIVARLRQEAKDKWRASGHLPWKVNGKGVLYDVSDEWTAAQRAFSASVKALYTQHDKLYEEWLKVGYALSSIPKLTDNNINPEYETALLAERNAKTAFDRCPQVFNENYERS